MTYECEFPPIGELRLQHQTENWMLQPAKVRSQYSNWELVEDWSLWYTVASSLKFGDWISLVEDSRLYSRAWRSLCMLWTCIVFTWNGCAFLLELQNLMLHWTSISLNWCVEVVLRVWCAIMNLEVEDIWINLDNRSYSFLEFNKQTCAEFFCLFAWEIFIKSRWLSCCTMKTVGWIFTPLPIA